MKKILVLGIVLVLIAGVSAVYSSGIWNLVVGGGTSAFQIEIQSPSANTSVPGPLGFSGLGFETQVNRSADGTLSAGEKTTKTFKLRKLTKPFIKNIIGVPSIEQTGVNNDIAIWNWSKQVQTGSSTSFNRNVRISVLGEPGFGAEYKLLDAWPSGWELDSVTQGQAEKVGETYSIAYRDINRTG
ncbi:MAG: phage tail protein [Candidatus Diapherotrites archaeon]|nr:phage tail protein [Candidatus Diapherotrites archaeon]